MKKIVIVDGGPRKNMNTAQLLHRFAEGAKSVGEDVEVKSVRLYVGQGLHGVETIPTDNK